MTRAVTIEAVTIEAAAAEVIAVAVIVRLVLLIQPSIEAQVRTRLVPLRRAAVQVRGVGRAAVNLLMPDLVSVKVLLLEVEIAMIVVVPVIAVVVRAEAMKVVEAASLS